SQGGYTLSNLGPGTHFIRQVLQPGWFQAEPGASTVGAHVVSLTSGQSLTGRNFGDRPINAATISGQQFHDINGNGVKQPGEPALSGWTVFLDLNNNTGLETDEPRTVTDAQGNYTFAGLPPGTYVLRELFQAGWSPALPSSDFNTVTVGPGQNLTGIDFGKVR